MSARNRTLGLEIEAEAARAEILACGVMSGTESLQHWDSARTAKRLRRGSNANSLRGQNSAGFLEICAAFQRDNLRRHFRVRVLPPQPGSSASANSRRARRPIVMSIVSATACNGWLGRGSCNFPQRCQRPEFNLGAHLAELTAPKAEAANG